MPPTMSLYFKHFKLLGFAKYDVIIKIFMTDYRHLRNSTGVCFSPTLQSLKEKEFGISGHLYIFTFCEACDASEVHFSGLHFYTILHTLIA